MDEGTHTARPCWLFVCEGTRTEVNYLNGLGGYLQRHTRHGPVFDVRGTGENTTYVVGRAVRAAALDGLADEIGYERVFTVFDRDAFSAKMFNSAVEQSLARGYTPLWSNESIELWFWLHYTYNDVPLHRDEVTRKLSACMRREQGVPYRKNDTGIFARLMDNGKLRHAVESARRLHKKQGGRTPAQCEPCTTMYQLFDILEGEGIPILHL